ncbi:uncharacterized protein LOC128730456 [Anopheles nili]|uniref:uncharacterized protein LOC128730456 n=1 Tax=Anopheles nili TaxID=185578 RepID=UPI00237B87E2|nr:uncharacterized protein LOC128730456 [Anopheles nili]
MASSWVLLFLVGLALLAEKLQDDQASATANIIYSGFKLPLPRHRLFYKSVGERKIGPNLYEVSTIIQEDILLRKRCECMMRHRCRVPRNIFYLSNRDCHHREKVCCELLENMYDPANNGTATERSFVNDNEI